MRVLSSIEAHLWQRCYWLAIHLSRSRAATCAASISTLRCVMCSQARVWCTQRDGLRVRSQTFVHLKAEGSWKLASWKSAFIQWLKTDQPADYPFSYGFNSSFWSFNAQCPSPRRPPITSHSFFFFLFPVDFDRFNLPHQWGNPPRCVELWVDWVQ